MDEQLAVYCQVLTSAESDAGQLFFLGAPGGMGKNIISLLLVKIRSDYRITLTIASSGIAATLLEEAKKAHITFKLPLNLIQVETLYSISKQRNMGQVLWDHKLIVWDESTVCSGGVLTH